MPFFNKADAETFADEMRALGARVEITEGFAPNSRSWAWFVWIS